MFRGSRSLLTKSKFYSTKIMQEMIKHDYESSIEALNSLQSNAQYIKKKTSPGSSHNGEQLIQVRKYLSRSGLSLEKLDELSVIHIAGTKGKGTTCSFTEKILRNHGYTTGFFSSPHLLEVRERIRINGKPISRLEFAKYFWNIYNDLERQKSDPYDMPLYFRFLTIMAFNIFVDKKVDVAVIEVGIGGEYDCTNVLRKVPVVGITSLGIDHISLLGSTLDKIAWNKAGIMKENCRAFSVPQPQIAMDVLKQRSVEKNCQLKIINGLGFKTDFIGPKDIVGLNAGLAVALCEAWLTQRHNNNHLSPVMSPEKTLHALRTCQWPGRFQIIHDKNFSYYLDGAHTEESIRICSQWFSNATKKSNKKKALMFNITGPRNPEKLLEPLLDCNFDAVVFVTNISGKHESADNTIFASVDHLVGRCIEHKEVWLKLGANNEKINIFPTVYQALEFFRNQDSYDLLVTGSIHLIGSVLSIINPDLNN